MTSRCRPFAEVIGDPIAHSKSPTIHRFWLNALGIAADYEAIRIAPRDLRDYINERREDADWRGCNVTVPHKIGIMDLIDDPGDVRASIGAMNTVLRDSKGNVTGTNTDAAGFFAPIAGVNLESKPVAVVGNGGAAHAVLFALARAQVGPVTILARDLGKAKALLRRFALDGDAVPLNAVLPAASLLVNASVLGMDGQPPLSLDLSPLPVDAIVYDLVYAPLRTDLLRAAVSHGFAIVDGLEMLIGQAALAFELFFGAAPPRDSDDELRALLTR